MNLLFPPELRTASVVHRWSIARLFNKDSVAEHSFFVTFYALQIARLVNWAGPYDELTFAALMDDVEETFTSDIVSPVKRQIVDEGALDNFVRDQMKERLPGMQAQLDAIYESNWGADIGRIIKVADKIDAAIHLILEQRMGNAAIKPMYDDVLENLVVSWHTLGEQLHGGDDSGIDNDQANWRRHRALWNDQVYPALQSHWKFGGVGIQ